MIFTACEFERNSLVINMNDEKKANQIVNELISSIENKEENNVANVLQKLSVQILKSLMKAFQR